MRRVVSDPELPVDQLGYPLTRPHLPPKAIISLRIMMGRKLGQFGAFFLAKTGCRSGRRLVLEAFYPLLRGTLHPLADGSFRNPQSIGYVCLFPAPLL
jgi:hypothetical protein